MPQPPQRHLPDDGDGGGVQQFPGGGAGLTGLCLAEPYGRPPRGR